MLAEFGPVYAHTVSYCHSTVRLLDFTVTESCPSQVKGIADFLDLDGDGTINQAEIKNLFAKLAGTSVESIPDDHPGLCMPRIASLILSGLWCCCPSGEGLI